MANKSVGLLTFTFGANMKGFEKAMNKAQKKLKRFGKSMVSAGKSMTMGLTLPIVALGAASLKTFADFEQSMLKVKAISGATGDEFKALTESAKLLGSTTMFTATQVSELQLNLSKLGLTPKEINKSTSAILNLAQATDSDLAESATVAASVMNAFGLEAEDMIMISDVMADAFSSSALDLMKFQTAMASVAPVANQAGADIQRTSAILGVLVNNGIEASSAGTALRNVFIELAIQGKTWDEAMNEITSDVKPLAKAYELFGKKGASVATIIAGNSTEIQNLTADFQDSAGEAQKMADIMDSGVGGAMRRMKSQLEGVAIELGTELVPVFQKFVEWVEKGVKWFKTLDDSQKKSIVKWGLILAAIGPVLIIIGKMSIGIGALIKVTKGLIANPWLLVAAAVVILAKAVYDYTTTLRGAEKAKKSLLDVEVEAFANAKEEERQLKNKLILARDVTKSDEERKVAIAELNNKLVIFNGTLNLENIAETNVTNAINKHTEALINQAKIVGTTALISEAYGELMRTSKDATRALDDLNLIEKANEATAGLFQLLMAPLTGQTMDDVMKERGGNVVKSYTDGLEEEMDFYQAAVDELVALIPEADIITPVLGGAGALIDEVKELTDGTDDLTESTKQYSDAIDDNIIELGDQFQQYSLATDQLKGIHEWTLKLTDGQKLAGAGFQMFGDILTSSLDGALDNQENFFKLFIKNIKRAIRSLIIQLAVMTLIKALMGGGKAAFSLTSITGNLKEIMNIPMQEGGLVTGPTTALIGEAGPEVVIPLDRVQSMLGGGEQHITVTGKLIGNDIFLSNAKTGINRLRTT